MSQTDIATSESDRRIIERTAVVLANGEGRTMQEIADKSGVGRTTLYRRFKTRDDLIQAISEQALADATEALAAAQPQEGDARDALRRVIEGLIGVGDQYRVLFQERVVVSKKAEDHARFKCTIRDLVVRGQQQGVLNPSLPVDWIAGVAGATISTAIRLVGEGELARNHAADLVTYTLLSGVEVKDSPTD